MKKGLKSNCRALKKKRKIKSMGGKYQRENSLAVQWLGLCTFTAKGPGSIPGQRTNIPQASRCGQKKKKKKKKNEGKNLT